MAASSTFRVLYLGGSESTFAQLEQILCEEICAPKGKPSPTAHMVRVANQRTALAELRRRPVHCMLLEIDNRRKKRIRFCRTLRRRYPRLPMVAVCMGAVLDHPFHFDGYIEIPLNPKRAADTLQHFLDGRQKAELRVGPIYLDLSTRTVQGPRGQFRLPPKQCHLLHVLMRQKGKTVSRQEIMYHVWETEFLDDTRTLDVHVRWLREKIEPDPSRPVHLLTVRGEGYKLVA